MQIQLDNIEQRVIGCLLEKEKTTPEQYPLSLASLTTACNQKSNRDPVMSLSESEVMDALDSLRKKHLITESSGFGSRVSKFKHRFCNTEFGDLHLTEQELALICVLLLRGPQTPGELRTRTQRLCSFADVHETEQVLEDMLNRDGGALVHKLAREPGKRESRYRHVFAVESDETLYHESGDEHKAAAVEVDESRLAQLENMVLELTDELSDIKARLARLEGEH